jgi:hypothetical protein
MPPFEHEFRKFLLLRIAAFFTVLLAAWLQSFRVLAILDVNPNLALAVLIAYAAFERNFWYLGLLTIVAFFILFPFPMPLREFIAFGGAAISGVGVLLALRERFAIGAFLASLAGASVIFYLILDPGFLVRAPETVVFEALLNATYGTLAFAYLKFAGSPLEYR